MAWMQSRPTFLFHLILNSIILLREGNDESVCKVNKSSFIPPKSERKHAERERERLYEQENCIQVSKAIFRATNKPQDLVTGNGTGRDSHPRPWSQMLIKNVITPPTLMVSNHTVTEWNLDIYMTSSTLADQHFTP